MTRCMIAWMWVACSPLLAAGPKGEALHHVGGAELQGGAMDLYGSVMDGESVNYVYAAPTGARSSMRTTFTLRAVPESPQYVHLRARDDDFHTHCPLRIEVNGQVAFDEANPFEHPAFTSHKFAIPAGALKAGANTLVISNRATKGDVGMPPWIQVADVVVGPAAYEIRRDLTKNFYVDLPAEKRPFPEPLSEGRSPGFKWRGTKSWMWRPEQCLAEIPWLARAKMNFFMNCYTAMCDVEHYRWGDPRVNRWWEDLPEEKKAAYERVVKSCREHGVTFCFSMNPNICSRRMVNDNAPDSVDQLYRHYAWMQSLGVQWFNVSLDDITEGINARTQAHVVNEILRRLRAKDPKAQMIFCPTYYWGDGTGDKQRPYLEELARELDKDVYLFWTGDAVVGPITRKGADTFRRISQRRLFLWDNYPVNDDRPTMHLGPVIQRDADLCEVIDGYMGNPMCKQSEANRIPLMTCADYAWNPWDYDPVRSIGQAILQAADKPSQRAVLRDLVEAYPGMLVYASGNTGHNAVQAMYARLAATPHARPVIGAWIARLDSLVTRLDREFPEAYAAEKKTLADDLAIVKKKFAAAYGARP